MFSSLPIAPGMELDSRERKRSYQHPCRSSAVTPGSSAVLDEIRRPLASCARHSAGLPASEASRTTDAMRRSMLSDRSGGDRDCFHKSRPPGLRPAVRHIAVTDTTTSLQSSCQFGRQLPGSEKSQSEQHLVGVLSTMSGSRYVKRLSVLVDSTYVRARQAIDFRIDGFCRHSPTAWPEVLAASDAPMTVCGAARTDSDVGEIPHYACRSGYLYSAAPSMDACAKRRSLRGFVIVLTEYRQVPVHH